MAFRIDIASEGAVTILRVSGSLCGTAADRLGILGEPIEGPLILDLSLLQTAEAAGLDVIRALRLKGAEIRGATPYIRLLLNDTNGEKTTQGGV